LSSRRLRGHQVLKSTAGKRASNALCCQRKDAVPTKETLNGSGIDLSVDGDGAKNVGGEDCVL
jgi:hypothetical protein